MGESDIPFPLLSGQAIRATVNGVETFYQVSKQARWFDLKFDYVIPPAQKLTDQTITLGSGSGAINAFATQFLKEWVTWIDNDLIGVTWSISSVNINQLQGYGQPLTLFTSPAGSVNFPMFNFNNPAGNVTFDISNFSLTQYAAGTLHVMLYDYQLKNLTAAPSVYTDISYSTGR